MQLACDPIALTQALVRMDTINLPGNEDQCTHHLAALLTAAGFECKLVDFAPHRTSLVARIGGIADKLPLVFTGHVDVVPLGAKPWTQAPFGGDVVDGKLYGRGTTDMKAGVAAFTAAAMDLADKLTGTAGVILVITAGEETGCEGAAHLVRQPDIAAMLGQAGALVVAEPTSNRPLAGHKGAFWLRASAKGVTAHGSMPQHGDNAIYKLAPALQAMQNFDFGIAPHEIMGLPSLNVGTVIGGINVNSVPDAAAFTIDIRSVPGQDHQHIVEQLRAALGPDISLEVLLDLASVYTNKDDPWIRYLCDMCIDGETAGSEAYFTDAAILRSALGYPPTVILGPGEAHMAHQTDEYCRVDYLLASKDIYTRIITDWCLS